MLESIPIGGDPPPRRYFDNPFVADVELGNRVDTAVTKEQLYAWIDRLVERLMIKLRNLGQDEMAKRGPYTGPGGIAYALHRVTKLPIYQSAEKSGQKEQILQYANRTISAHLAATASSSSSASRYLTGGVGLKVVQAVVGGSCPTSVGTTMEVSDVFSGITMPEENEVLNGKAGILLGALTLQQEANCELDEEVVTTLLKTILVEGRNFAKRSPIDNCPPLMWQWHDKEYLGAAHGVTGILQALLNYFELLPDDRARKEVKATLDWLVSLQADDGNFPSSSSHIGEARHELVHWCHGAPGVVHLLVTAALTFHSSQDDFNRYTMAARRCADLIWARGLLRKGPGLCHGVAGNGYAFLLLYRLTAEVEYLRRARLFAAVVMEEKFERLARTPDSSWSLFEGWAGTLCFLVDLLLLASKAQPAAAIRFPLCPIIVADKGK